VVKLTNEFRYYFLPDDRDFAIHELIFDQLYLQYKRPLDLPFDLTVGRQNIILGEGFIVMDGHPLDGSRSIYFNGGRADITVKPGHKVTFFGVRQNRTDDVLPVFNEQDQSLIEQPEEGFGFYYSGKIKSNDLELYVVRKNVLEVTDNNVPGSSVNTFGFRGVLPLTKRLAVTAEMALQSGKAYGTDRKAWGGYFHADYKTEQKFPIPATITLGGIGLSGDDPSTQNWEGWDPVFSRWPKWSESYIYTQIREFGGRVGYWSNFTSIYGTMAFQIAKPALLTLHCHKLGAFEESITSSGFAPGGGTDRGWLFIAKLTGTLAKPLKGHLLYERLNPGDFYSANLDGYNWFRFELLYSWRS